MTVFPARPTGRFTAAAVLLTSACLAAAAAAVLLAGCASTVSDDVSLEAVQNRGEAIAIVAATFPGPRVCTSLTLHVRQKGDDGDRIRSIVASVYGSGLPAQAKLPAGSYEIANMICQSVNVKVVLHEQRTIFSSKKTPPPVYGRFSVAAGEVVNLGHVKIKSAFGGIAQLAVTDLSTQQRTWLKDNRPTLESRMVTRLIKTR